MGTGENAVNQFFSPFPTMFSTLPPKKIDFFCNVYFINANALYFDQSKILLFGKVKELTIYCTVIYEYSPNSKHSQMITKI